MLSIRKEQRKEIILLIITLSICMVLRRFTTLLDGLAVAGFVMYWAIVSRQKIINNKVRRLFTASCYCIILFLFIRTAKYHCFTDHDTISRYLWYLYYFPMLFVPTMSLNALFRIDEDDRPTKKWWVIGAYLLSAFLFFLVMTNDAHQMVFSFPPGATNAQKSTDYSYGFLYYLITVWIFFGVIYILGSLILRQTAKSYRHRRWIVIAPVLAMVIYNVVYRLGRKYAFIQSTVILDLTLTYTLFFVVCWLLILQLGLVETNVGHDLFLEHSTLSVRVADADGRTVSQTPRAGRWTAEEFEKIRQNPKDPLVTQEGERLRGRAITGGMVYWGDSIQEALDMNESLRDMQEQLAEEGSVLEAENEIRRQKAVYETQNRVYDAISEEIRPQLTRMEALLSGDLDEGTFRENLKRACVLGGFVKRYSNLMLIAEGKEWIEREELLLALRESMRYLKQDGISGGVFADGTGYSPAWGVLDAYRFFEDQVETVYEWKEGVLVSLKGLGPDLSMKITMDCREGFTGPSGVREEITERDGFAEVRRTWVEDTLGVAVFELYPHADTQSSMQSTMQNSVQSSMQQKEVQP